LLLIHQPVDLFSSGSVAFEPIKLGSLESFFPFAKFALSFSLLVSAFGIKYAVNRQESIVSVSWNRYSAGVVHLTRTKPVFAVPRMVGLGSGGGLFLVSGELGLQLLIFE
jgi:hypothetical protein